MDKKAVVYPYNEILLNNGKEVVPIHGSAWIILRNNMLSKISWTWKMTHCMILFIWDSKNVNFIYNDRKQISGFLGLGMRGWLMGRSTKVVFEVTKIFYILIEVVLTEMSKLTELYTQNWWIVLYVSHTSIKLIFKKFVLTSYPSSFIVPFLQTFRAKLLERTVYTL